MGALHHGPGASGAGNSALVKQGADELSEIAHLDEGLHESVVATPVEDEASATN
jgi:hypothetical protein